jgi:hypothetical protein
MNGLYRLRLAAVPEQGPCTVLELAEWQQQALEDLAARILTDRQRQALDEAQIKVQARALVDQAEEHLR